MAQLKYSKARSALIAALSLAASAGCSDSQPTEPSLGFGFRVLPYIYMEFTDIKNPVTIDVGESAASLYAASWPQLPGLTGVVASTDAMFLVLYIPETGCTTVGDPNAGCPYGFFDYSSQRYRIKSGTVKPVFRDTMVSGTFDLVLEKRDTCIQEGKIKGSFLVRRR